MRPRTCGPSVRLPPPPPVPWRWCGENGGDPRAATQRRADLGTGANRERGFSRPSFTRFRAAWEAGNSDSCDSDTGWAMGAWRRLPVGWRGIWEKAHACWGAGRHRLTSGLASQTSHQNGPSCDRRIAGSADRPGSRRRYRPARSLASDRHSGSAGGWRAGSRPARIRAEQGTL